MKAWYNCGQNQLYSQTKSTCTGFINSMKQMPFLRLKGYSRKKSCCFRSKWNHSALFCTNCLHLMIPEYRNTNINFLGKALSFLHLSVAKTAIAYFSTFVLSILHLMVVGMTTFSRRHGDFIEWVKLHLSAVLTQGCQIYSS